MGGGLFIVIRGGVTESTSNIGQVYFSDRQFLMLHRGETAPDEEVLDAFAAFDEKHDKMAVIFTEADKTVIFLPRQFYSGTWTIFKPMSEKDTEEDPLPALDDLAKLIRRLA